MRLAWIRRTFAAALVLGAAACAGRANGAHHDPEWNMEGVIVSVQAGAQQTQVTVDAEARDGAQPARVVVLVASDTEVGVRLRDGTARAGTVADLTAGAHILVRHTGIEMRSYPPQYRATHVRVLRER